MKDEIKRKIDFIKQILNQNELIRCSRYFNDLLDYITNLQQENERLKELNAELKAITKRPTPIDYAMIQKRYDDYKSRCEKAIEVIKQFDTDKNFTFPLMPKWEEKQVKASIKLEFKDTYKRHLLNILQNGSDEE